jgi:pimeloyl-ACP methyl ester carboxylesterase
MPRADSDGVSIHYELAGTGDALVLIGGLGVHTGEYRPLIDALARHHRVLAADNRGAGSSDKPDEPYSYGMMAADTLAAMGAAGVGAADIVGFSMGARIAIECCLAHPERVRTLTLIAGRPAGRSRRRTRLLARVAAAADRDGGHGIRNAPPTKRRERLRRQGASDRRARPGARAARPARPRGARRR